MTKSDHPAYPILTPPHVVISVASPVPACTVWLRYSRYCLRIYHALDQNTPETHDTRYALPTTRWRRRETLSRGRKRKAWKRRAKKYLQRETDSLRPQQFQGKRDRIKTLRLESLFPAQHVTMLAVSDGWPCQAVFAGDIDPDTQPVSIQRMEAPLVRAKRPEKRRRGWGKMKGAVQDIRLRVQDTRPVHLGPFYSYDYP